MKWLRFLALWTGGKEVLFALESTGVVCSYSFWLFVDQPLPFMNLLMSFPFCFLSYFLYSWYCCCYHSCHSCCRRCCFYFGFVVIVDIDVVGVAVLGVPCGFILFDAGAVETFIALILLSMLIYRVVAVSASFFFLLFMAVVVMQWEQAGEGNPNGVASQDNYYCQEHFTPSHSPLPFLLLLPFCLLPFTSLSFQNGFLFLIFNLPFFYSVLFS